MKPDKTLAAVVAAHRGAQEMSLRQFAGALNANLINTGISRETVRLWECSDPGYEPNMAFLFECIATYEDWRASFAADCLRAMYPDLIGSKIVVNVPS